MAGERRELDQTPTWAVALVCLVIIFISISLEKVLHRIGKARFFTDKNKRKMYDALEKIKTELMVLGFISLLLTFSRNFISSRCVSYKIADSMLPCARNHDHALSSNSCAKPRPIQGRRKCYLDEANRLDPAKSGSFFRSLRRLLTAEEQVGKEPLITTEGVDQLHILIFFLAVFHVVCSAITMTLGRLKIRRWKEWESEISSHNYEKLNGDILFLDNYRLAHETSFVKAHTGFWTRFPLLFYVGSFLRQFYKSVTKTDYIALRNGFLTAHISPGTNFNFQKYIKRSLEEDFKVVVGVSPVLWASFVIFLLLNVHGWQTFFWASFIPLILILAVGTKLQAILADMAHDIIEKQSIVQGIPLVKACDTHFWFSKPQMMLHLLHFVLFQNAFQITYFLWIWYEYGFRSCFHDHMSPVIIRLVVGAFVLFLCSYITLPLYALVSQYVGAMQMGSTMKKAVFNEQTSSALMRWTESAKKKKRAEKFAKQATPATSKATDCEAGNCDASPRTTSFLVTVNHGNVVLGS
ncbi:MLO-like protein [Drosera capensis]